VALDLYFVFGEASYASLFSCLLKKYTLKTEMITYYINTTIVSTNNSFCHQISEMAFPII